MDKVRNITVYIPYQNLQDFSLTFSSGTEEHFEYVPIHAMRADATACIPMLAVASCSACPFMPCMRADATACIPHIYSGYITL